MRFSSRSPDERILFSFSAILARKHFDLSEGAEKMSQVRGKNIWLIVVHSYLFPFDRALLSAIEKARLNKYFSSFDVATILRHSSCFLNKFSMLASDQAGRASHFPFCTCLLLFFVFFFLTRHRLGMLVRWTMLEMSKQHGLERALGLEERIVNLSKGFSLLVNYQRSNGRWNSHLIVFRSRCICRWVWHYISCLRWHAHGVLTRQHRHQNSPFVDWINTE